MTTTLTTPQALQLAVETLQAQINRADRLPWRLFSENLIENVVQMKIADTLDTENAELIVTLANSARATLGILQLAQEYGDLPAGHGSRFVRQARVLALSILGSDFA